MRREKEKPSGEIQVVFHKENPAPLNSTAYSYPYADWIANSVVKTLAVLLGVVVYPLMAIFMVAVPFLFFGGIWQVFANPPSNLEGWYGALMVILVSGAFTFYLYRETKDSYERFVARFWRKK